MKVSPVASHIQIRPDLTYHLTFDGFQMVDDLSLFETGQHLGQFAFLREIKSGSFEAVRDPLGIGKLFYTETKSGALHFSGKFGELFQYESPIYSVPPGRWVRIESGKRRELIREIGIPKEINEDLNLEAFEGDSTPAVSTYQQDFDTRLDKVFAILQKYEAKGWTIFLALSGGLDSTIIGNKAATHLAAPIATTLDLGKSEDSEKSQKIAAHLGLQHEVFQTTEQEILDALEVAPTLCQDFRDFNIHCAALNILLAEKINQYVASNDIDTDKVIVLTGDLMNEFTCDYAGEVVDGVEYYKLPRAGKKKVLQKHLIKGLDTSDRELSVFQKYGLRCVQPFACLYDLYESIPESVLQAEDPKKILNSFQVDSAIIDFLPKEKLRAQVGSRESMGILGLCHKKGFTDDTYKQQLLGNYGYPDAKIPIFIGRYDIESFA